MENKRSSPSCIGIVGLGLIGGSLGLDLQALGYEVHGLVHRSSTAQKAQDRKLAQVISIDTKILSDCELIILALPLDQLLKPSDYLLSALPKSAVITDVGSVKAPVVKVWRELHQNFVGSHPMAGTNDSGVGAGKKGLFNKRPWVTTPEAKTNQNSQNLAVFSSKKNSKTAPSAPFLPNNMDHINIIFCANIYTS